MAYHKALTASEAVEAMRRLAKLTHPFRPSSTHVMRQHSIFGEKWNGPALLTLYRATSTHSFRALLQFCGLYDLPVRPPRPRRPNRKRPDETARSTINGAFPGWPYD